MSIEASQVEVFLQCFEHESVTLALSGMSVFGHASIVRHECLCRSSQCHECLEDEQDATPEVCHRCDRDITNLHQIQCGRCAFRFCGVCVWFCRYCQWTICVGCACGCEFSDNYDRMWISQLITWWPLGVTLFGNQRDPYIYIYIYMKSVNTFRNYLVSQTTSLFSQHLPNKPKNDT